MERRLAAILAADVVGYSRLMGKDDAGTLTALKACEANLIEPTIARHHGRIFKRMGDGYLAEFASAVSAVECALDWQNQMQENETYGLKFRIGTSLGEVIGQDDDVYGDGVNVAARLEALAQPGCIILSGDTYRQVRDRVDVEFDDLGEQELKNISRPLQVWEWRCKFVPPRSLISPKLLPPVKPSVVILPFRNLSGGDEQDSLAEGLRLDIQSALTQVSGVFLIAMGAADAFAGATPSEAGTALGVQYGLQCSLRSAGNRIRVTAELKDGRDNSVVWAEQFDRILDDEFALQDEITARVLTAMNVKLVAGEQAKIWHRSLKSLKTLGLFYKGLHAFNEMDRDQLERARQYFETVFSLEPDTALGPTWVALCHWYILQKGWAQSPDQTRELACTWAERAATKEDQDGQAQTVLSHVHLINRDYKKALASGRAATSTRPGCANANAFFANVLHHCGENDEAIRHINLAIRYHPLNPPLFRNILAGAYLAKGELESAIATAIQVAASAPGDVTARLILISAFVKSDRLESAKEIASEVLHLEPGFSIERFANSQHYRDIAYLKAMAAELLASGLPD